MDRDLLHEHSSYTEHCSLCHINPHNNETKIYHVDTDFIVLECRTYHIPMIVYRYHTMTLPIDTMLDLHRIIAVMFGPDTRLRMSQRVVKHHWYAHIITKEP